MKKNTGSEKTVAKTGGATLGAISRACELDDAARERESDSPAWALGFSAGNLTGLSDVMEMLATSELLDDLGKSALLFLSEATMTEAARLDRIAAALNRRDS